MNFTGTWKTLGITDAAWGYPAALAQSLNPNIGTEIGNFIYCDDTCAEITNKTETQYQLVALGWTDKSKCRLTP